jgi:hypothetical protein
VYNIGLDIGKSQLHICRSLPASAARDWPVTVVEYANLDWHTRLADLIPPGSAIAFEPTGYHYLRPILAALEIHQVNATLWQLPNHTTQHIRMVHVSAGKSDLMDARALALAADWLAEGRTVRGAYRHQASDEAAQQNLRNLVNQRAHLVRDQTRALNRLDQIAHALWPTLAIKKELWLKAAALGAVTPDQVIALARRPDLATLPGYEHGNARAALKKLAASLPDLVIPPTLIERSTETLNTALTIAHLVRDLDQLIAATITKPPFDCITARWMTVPYASPLAIAALHVATHGHANTYSPDEFKTAVGAAPITQRSGRSEKRAHTRPGYRPAISAIWFWTMRLIKPESEPNPISHYYEQSTNPNRFRQAVSKLARTLSGVSRSEKGYIYEYNARRRSSRHHPIQD